MGAHNRTAPISVYLGANLVFNRKTAGQNSSGVKVLAVDAGHGGYDYGIRGAHFVEKDFVLAFAVAHEVPDARSFFAEIFKAMKPGARCLLAEPKGHVSSPEFEQTLAAAEQTGFRVAGNPRITRCYAAVLSK